MITVFNSLEEQLNEYYKMMESATDEITYNYSKSLIESLEKDDKRQLKGQLIDVS